MSVHHIVGNEALGYARRLSPAHGAPHRGRTRRRGAVDWRFVGLVLVAAVLLIAMVGRV